MHSTQKKLVLDIYQTAIQTVFAKQYDNETRYIIIQIVDRGELISLYNQNIYVNFKAKTSKNRTILQQCEIQNDDTILVELNDNILYDGGNTDCEIQLIDSTTDSNKVLSTMPFILQVKPSVFQDEDVSPEEYSILIDLTRRLESLNITLENLEANVEETEALRVSAENTRISNENARISAEEVREDNEDTRIANENIRISNEDTRQTNETDRISTMEQIEDDLQTLEDELDAVVLKTQLGVASTADAIGVATLNDSGLIPASQLPSYVDDVLEYDNLASFPTVGETGKIYVAKNTGLIYRWSGSQYIEISRSPILNISEESGGLIISLT